MQDEFDNVSFEKEFKRMAEENKRLKKQRSQISNQKIPQTKHDFPIQNTNTSDANALADAIISKYDSSWGKRKNQTYKKHSKLKIWLITNSIKLIITILALYVGFSYLEKMGLGGISNIFNNLQNENISLEDIDSLSQYGVDINNSNMDPSVYGQMPKDINGVFNIIQENYSMYDDILDY